MEPFRFMLRQHAMFCRCSFLLQSLYAARTVALGMGMVDGANRGDRRGVLFLQAALIYPVLGALGDYAGKDEHCNAVRHCHQGVGDIGEVPNKVAAADAAPEHEDQEHNLVGTMPLVPKR